MTSPEKERWLSMPDPIDPGEHSFTVTYRGGKRTSIKSYRLDGEPDLGDTALATLVSHDSFYVHAKWSGRTGRRQRVENIFRSATDSPGIMLFLSRLRVGESFLIVVSGQGIGREDALPLARKAEVTRWARTGRFPMNDRPKPYPDYS